MNNQSFEIIGGPINEEPTKKESKKNTEKKKLSILGGPVEKDELQSFYSGFDSKDLIDTDFQKSLPTFNSSKLFIISLILFTFLVFLNFSIEFTQYSFALSQLNGYLSIVAFSGLGLGLFQWIYSDLKAISQLKTSYKLRVTASNLYNSLSQGEKIPLSQVKDYFLELSNNWSSQSDYSKKQLLELKSEIDCRLKNKTEVEPIIYLKRLDEEILYDIDQKVKSTIHKKVLRCAISTGISNIALVDACFFILIYLSLVKEVCQHYGYRPGPIGTIWILKSVGTGALLASSSQTLLNLAPEAFSQEFAAKLGQGSLMGLWMLKSGYHLMEICRPFPKSLNQQNSYTQEFFQLFSKQKAT
ncbi:MAG: hypothetical protein COB02_09920 [Candidatus Cloacimonadota bacterium]|nr:MAG: hypothetical protein COB02_09920 [Candidatus Cloacimonadota bacterium]